MALNLFTGPLEELRLEDIDGFLALGGPADARPHEGTRIDYKEEVPDKIGETVAALANTDGGIIILGVSEKDGIPVDLVGVPADPRSDLKTRIANTICSNLQPRPRFEIGVVALDGTVKALVAVLRVEEGDYPPYMFTKGGVNKIPIRVADRNALADLRTIEAMFGRRAQVDAEDDRPFPGGDVLISNYENGNKGPSRTRLMLRVRPRRHIRLPIDAAFERKILRVLARATGEAPGTVVGRRRDYFQTILANPASNHERGWRIGGDGSVAFATQILSPDRQQVLLQDLVSGALKFCMGAKAILREVDCHGRLDLELSLNLDGVPVRSMAMGNLRQPGETPVFQPSPVSQSLEDARLSIPLDLSELDDPVTVVVVGLNDRLRDLTGAALDLDAFDRAVRDIWDSIQGNI